MALGILQQALLDKNKTTGTDPFQGATALANKIFPTGTINSKLAQLQAEAKIAQDKAKQASSIGGLLKNTITGIPQAAQQVANTVNNYTLKPAAEALVVRPAVRAGQAIGSVGLTVADKLSGGKLSDYTQQKFGQNLTERMGNVASQETKTPLGINVQPVKPLDQGGVRQIAGEGLEAASYLYTPGKVASSIGPLLKGAAQPIAKTALSIAEGTFGGYLGDVGMGLQDQNKSLPQAFKPGMGALAGGILPAAASAYQIGKEAKVLYNSMTPAERQAGKIKNPLFPGEVPKNIHPEDAGIMTKFIDNARIKTPLSDAEFALAEKLAQKFGISMDGGIAKVASRFEDILSGAKEVTGTLVPGSYKKLTTQGGYIKNPLASEEIPKINEDILPPQEKEKTSTKGILKQSEIELQQAKGNGQGNIQGNPLPSSNGEISQKGILKNDGLEVGSKQADIPKVENSQTYNNNLPDKADPVNVIVQALKEAKPLEKEQAKIYSIERSKRVARIAAMGEKVPGEKGYFAQLGQLKGEMPKVEFESLRSKIKQTDIDSLFNKVEQTKIFSPFEKVTAKGALAKILGHEGGRLPTRNEIALLSEVFPPEFIQAVLEKRSFWQKAVSVGVDALNIPRSIMATMDLSAPLRQGVFMVGKPKQWIPAFKDMFKYAFNEKAYTQLTESIQARPTYKYMRESGLALTNTGKFMDKREEQFMSNLVERVPGFGRLSKISSRAYTGFLNKLRADVFDDLLKNAKELGLHKERPQVIKDIATFVNSATGRGDLGALNRAAPVLNGVFFSPRLMASRINLLNPVYYAKLDPFVRKEALKSLLTFGSVASSVLGLAKLGGAEVGADPRSADFGKIKLGNTRYDILGGFQQYIKLASQLATGKVISSTTGKEITLGEGYNPLTRKDVLMRFLESKENPAVSFATSLMTGQTSLGESLNVPTEIINRSIPLVVQDLYSLQKEYGPIGLAMGIPGVFGAGSQTYGSQELITGKNKIGQESAQIKPIGGLGEDISNKTFGRDSLGSSSSYNVDAYYDQMLKLPKEEAKRQFDIIIEKNPNLAKKITAVVKERQLGITIKDKTLKAKGVESGDRAMAIAEELKALKTKEEKGALWGEYIKKGIITEAVSKQLLQLIK